MANYAGVTVERVEGTFVSASGKRLRVLDLPGAYSLYPRSPDERVTYDVLFGRAADEKQPDLVVCVVDATNLRRNLRLALAVKRLGLPCVVALNMADLAEKRGIRIDPQALSTELGLPVVSTVAIAAMVPNPCASCSIRPTCGQQPPQRRLRVPPAITHRYKVSCNVLVWRR